MTPFHLSFPVHDLAETRRFYVDMLGCEIGRSSESWIDFTLFGHQMSAHLVSSAAPRDIAFVTRAQRDVPIPHFGVVLLRDDWDKLAKRLEANQDTVWIERPKIRFNGKPHEQATLFIRDPSGNALEFKGFLSLEQVFAH